MGHRGQRRSDLRARKSLPGKSCCASNAQEKSAHRSPYGVRLSMEDFAEYESIHVYPVYAVSRLVRGQGRRIVFYLNYASFLETYGLQ